MKYFNRHLAQTGTTRNYLTMSLDTWNDRLRLALQRAKDRGMTQEKLAGTLGITQGSISNYKNGTREPDLGTFRRLANALNVSPEWLLFGNVVRVSDEEMELLSDYREAENEARHTIRNVASLAKSRPNASNSEKKPDKGKKRAS